MKESIILIDGRLLFLWLKYIIIGIMRHNIFYAAIQDIAQFIYGIYFYILIMAKSVQLGTVHMITSVQIILGDSLRLHCFPQLVVFYHSGISLSYKFMLSCNYY